MEVQITAERHVAYEKLNSGQNPSLSSENMQEICMTSV